VCEGNTVQEFLYNDLLLLGRSWNLALVFCRVFICSKEKLFVLLLDLLSFLLSFRDLVCLSVSFFLDVFIFVEAETKTCVIDSFLGLFVEWTDFILRRTESTLVEKIQVIEDTVVTHHQILLEVFTHESVIMLIAWYFSEG
jgi:hypothetical protein